MPATTIGDAPHRGSTTLNPMRTMRFNKVDVGKRIATLRVKRGILKQAELCRRMVAAMQKPAGPSTSDSGSKRGRNLTPQAISSWENGEALPAPENIALLVEVLDTSEEELLLGGKDGDKNVVQGEKLYLSYISAEELDLLSARRAASKEGQRLILKNAKGIAEELPAPEATIHPFRRKTDPPPK